MSREEFLLQYIAQLQALPRWNRLEALREIQDPALLQQVVLALPVEVYSEILTESMLNNLRRNVQERTNPQIPQDLAA